jgi:hypothetical protein
MRTEFRDILGLAIAWVAQQEETALLPGSVGVSPASSPAGLALTQSQLADARSVGVQHPERVRLLQVPQIPMPQHPLLRKVCDETGAIGPRTQGLCVRYGILIRADHWLQREIVVHELVHTAQYERLGGIEQFLERYLHECFTVGYPNGEMEQEAIRLAAMVVAT